MNVKSFRALLVVSAVLGVLTGYWLTRPAVDKDGCYHHHCDKALTWPKSVPK